MFREPRIDDVNAEEAVCLHDQGAVIVDVREHDEWIVGHAPGAVHVPLSSVGREARRFADREVLTVCRTGRRSARAAKVLAKAGADVLNVAGGMSSWAAAGLPVVRDDGGPGAVA